MKYIDKHLTQNEQVILTAKVSFKSLIAPIIVFLFFSLFGISLIVFTLSNKTVVMSNLYIGLGIISIGLIFLIERIVCVMGIVLAVTNKKIIGKIGVFSVKTMDTPIEKVNTVSVQQNLFQRLLGYGRIAITSSSGSYNFSSIKNYDEIRSAIMDQIEILKNE